VADETPAIPPDQSNTLSSAEIPPTEPAADDELPQYEELTPEYLEDECLRGDVMLRWATILLGTLLGWMVITDTPVLVSIRTGEYLFSHGILPPRVDVFSATAAGRPWVNPGWLTDLVMAAVHGLLGMPGLTVLCAVTVGLTMWSLSRAVWPNVTTWWGSTCSLLALVACFPLFQPGGATITLLGLGLLAWNLSRGQIAPTSRASRLLIPLMILWGNLDSNSWIGLAVLLLFLVGECFSGGTKTTAGRARLRDQGIALLAGLLVSPWPFQALFQFRNSLLAQEQVLAYQGLRDFFPRLDLTLLQPEFWKTLDFFSFAGLSLLAISGLTLLLNGKKTHPGWALSWLGINLLGLVWGEGFCLAAVWNAVVATLNGTDWCRRLFKMNFDVTRWNVLWSRFGRAGHVLTLSLIAYVAINGALMGAQGRRIGFGLDPRWGQRIDSLKTEILPAASSNRILPTTPAQGDLLIWLGQKPFVDSRFPLYRRGGEDLLALHRALRTELFLPPAEGNETPAEPAWKAVLAHYQINDLFVRLWGPRPPYLPFFRVDANPDWELTALGSAGALLTRSDLDSPELKAHLQAHEISDFARLAFRPESGIEPDTLEATWPLPVSSYNSWLVQPLELAPPAAELAGHYLALLTESGRTLTHEQAAGLGYLTLRASRRGLIENPNHPLPYRMLGKGCQILTHLEQQRTGNAGVRLPMDFYETQVLSSAYSAVIAGQENPGDLLELFQIQMARRNLDGALDSLNRYNLAMERRPHLSVAPEMRTELNEVSGKLKLSIQEVTDQVNDANSASRPLMEQAAIAMGGGCPRLALSLLEKDRTRLSAEPELQLFYATLLLQCGRVENAMEQVEGLGAQLNGPQASAVPPMFKSQWRSIAKTVHLAANHLTEYVKLSSEEEEQFWVSAIQPLLQMPFAAMQFPLQMELWPAYVSAVTAESAIQLPEMWGQVQYSLVRAELERGALADARDRLQRLFLRVPRFSLRSVAAMYLSALTGEAVSLPDKPAEVPEWIRNFDSRSQPQAPPDVTPAPESDEKSEDKPKPEDQAETMAPPADDMP